MRIRYTYFALLKFLLLSAVQAQHFSEDKVKFRAQALSGMRNVGTESAKKITSDFQQAWDTKFTSAQQDKVHQIALTMQKKGYAFYPFYYHYFTYLAYSVAQENLQRDELTKLLLINEQVVETLNKEEYEDFVFGLNIYMARGFLSLEKTLLVQADGGSYSFRIIDEPPEKTEGENQSILVVAEEASSMTGIDRQPRDNFGGEQDNTDGSWANTFDDSWGDDNQEEESWDSAPQATYYQESEPLVPELTVSRPDYVAEKRNRYVHPILQGPAIDIKDAQLLIATSYDSMRVNNIHATFLLQNRTLAASQGTVKWPDENSKFRGATVQLKNFHLKKDRSDFWTPNATLRFENLFGGEVEGVFVFKSVKRPNGSLSNYPVFTSNDNNVTIKLDDEKLSYTGGVELQGNKLMGRAISKKRGTLTILDGKGNKVLLKSDFFELSDTVIRTENSTISILHGGDSVTHKSVRARYDIPTGTLIVLRNSTLTPYTSSYFDVAMNVDLIKWNMERDTIVMEVLNGKDQIPATFESSDFFDPFRFKKLGRFLDFHPISSAVFYARKHGRSAFYTSELAGEFDIDERFAKGAAKILTDYDFADYDKETELIQLHDKASLYYDASAKKVDYDNLMVPSKMANGPNAYFRLDSGKLHVRGVSRFYVTTDFKIYAAPFDSTVTLLEGRNIEFDGKVHTLDFDYQGVGHQFDYQAFLFSMPQIDSIQISVTLQDSTNNEGGGPEKTKLSNQIKSTSGTLYADKADNRSGRVENGGYPFFATDSDAVVYFDGPEILNGAYDKSVQFVIPPFQMDSIESSDRESVSFEGIFNSGNIFPPFQETLRIQEDKSLGFKHKIPDQGYNLYGTQAKTYEEISLSNQGIRGYGQIDFLSTTIYSDDFIYYPDSVTSMGTSGIIDPGTIGGASYPEAILGRYDLYWLSRQDSMYLKNIEDPFKFYHSTAELDGEINITTKGVFGSGTMLTRGSKSVSSDLTFKEFEYGARHADFEILTDNPTKPAMAGKDIWLDFDLATNMATVKPERRGVAAISFPYAQMKTSITEAVWDLEAASVAMSKPASVPIEDSYFFSTKEDLDSLAFNAEKATYNINTQELKVEGIPYIIVADSKIIPRNNETTILANSELRKFENAEIIIDALNGYHYLDRASIQVISSKKFEGNAFYKHVTGKDTFNIRFDSFELQEVPVGASGKRRKSSTQLMTVSGGEVLENQNLIISPGFLYKGSVAMYAYKRALELDGLVKLNIENNDNWIRFRRTDEEHNVQLPIDNAELESGNRARAGIHQNIGGEYYTTFVETKQTASDADFFNASGLLSYPDTLGVYKIETRRKTMGESYEGGLMTFEDHSQNIVFEGPVNFFGPETTDMTIRASALGKGNKHTNKYQADVMMILDFKISDKILAAMTLDLTEIIERIGSPPTNDISMEMMHKVANLIGDETTKTYETSSLKDYVSLVSMDQDFEKPLVLSEVGMRWSKKHKAWYSVSKIGLSNIMRNDINAKLDGFLEIKRDETGADALTLFIQAAPGVWYYIGYSKNQLVLLSSNPKFNREVDANSNIGKERPGTMLFVKGDENETLSFINRFRRNYFGIEEPYNLISPDDINVEDDQFDTIEDDDDGFGFD